MKRLISFSLVAALAAGAAFAQVAEGISIDAWGRGAFAPLIIQGAEWDGQGDKVKDSEHQVFAGTGNTWNDSVYADINIRGATDYVGFGVGIRVSPNEGDFFNRLNGLGAHVWVKPFGSDLLKITAGKFKDGTLEGKIGEINDGFAYFSLRPTGYLSVYDGSLGNYLGDSEEDQIFTAFETDTHGFMLSSRPIDPLYIGFKVDTGNRGDYGLLDDPKEGREVYRFMQIGVGYEIEGVGLARAQFVGGHGGKYKNHDLVRPDTFSQVDPARIEAAFAFTGKEDLVVDFGLKFWMPVTVEQSGASDLTAWKGLNASLGAKFTSGALGIAARIDTGFAGHYGPEDDWTYEDPFRMNLRVTPSYNLDFATVGVDLGLGVVGENKEKDDGLSETYVGIGAFIQKDFGGNGFIKTGLTYSFVPSSDNEFLGRDIFSIPVVMEFSF